MEQIRTEQTQATDDEPPLIQTGDREATSPVSRSDNRSSLFRKRWFPGTNQKQWDDWHWQLSHRITTLSQLSRFLDLTEEEEQALIVSETALPFSVTPYYLSLIDPDDPLDPLRKTVVPSIYEVEVHPGESVDPLQEDRTSPTKGIIHRYPDRVLFLVTSFCSVYCRYCTRSRLVGGHEETAFFHWEQALAYIERHDEVRDVLISGGDPLTLSDDRIDYLLGRLAAIKHVEMVRIGTKVPFVLPQRITGDLVKALRRYQPLYVSIHATHPNEMTEESKKACNRLADAGIVMGSQTVLLKGINDSADVLRTLFHQLLHMRVRPYYLFQCDPIVGSAHFRTSVATGKKIMGLLRGYTSGYAIPYYVIDTPGGGGKVPILPDYEVGRNEQGIILRNYEGKLFTYPDFPEEGER